MPAISGSRRANVTERDGSFAQVIQAKTITGHQSPWHDRRGSFIPPLTPAVNCFEVYLPKNIIHFLFVIIIPGETHAHKSFTATRKRTAALLRRGKTAAAFFATSERTLLDGYDTRSFLHLHASYGTQNPCRAQRGFRC